MDSIPPGKCQCGCDGDTVFITKRNRGHRSVKPGVYRKWLPGHNTSSRYTETLEQHLLRWLDRSGGPDACWPFTGSKSKFGYGMFTHDRKYGLAHRRAYELWKGPIPKGLNVLHDCDFAPCCNPDHLHLGTLKDNMDERADRNRTAIGARNGRHTHPETTPRGEGHCHAKLTEEGVKDIRLSFEHGETKTELTRRYKVDMKTVRNVINRVTWKHIA